MLNRLATAFLYPNAAIIVGLKGTRTHSDQSQTLTNQHPRKGRLREERQRVERLRDTHVQQRVDVRPPVTERSLNVRP